ncbi:relaxase domain-containing protein [Streptomyces sp. NPDC003710]
MHGLVAARFRHYEARSGMPLLHDHLLLSVKAQRPHKDKNGQGIWGSVHSEALLRARGGGIGAPQRRRDG